MIIAEARQLYNGQIKVYQEQQIILSKKKEEPEKKIQSTENEKGHL